MRASMMRLQGSLQRKAIASIATTRQPALRLAPLASDTQNSSRAPSASHNFSTTSVRRDDKPSHNNSPPNTTSRESILPQTHYDIFPSLGPAAIPPAGTFALDLGALKREFLQLQGRAHPDRVATDKKRQAEAASARINEAYKTLQNPLLRAQYLLSLRGIDVAEDETAKVEDQDLLMEVLETREVIEEAQTEEDLVPLKETNEKRVDASVAILDEAFRTDDLDTAKREAVKLRYWINIRESIHAWEQGKPVVLNH
ncbi:hypothetical protein AAFC00_002863 [Neodothiora populina]|uniref:J domain-containing protein n=1 Tax=Neodothiora populina TaxID=2781224 RepID=A0ABR3P8H6_9PEZI